MSAAALSFRAPVLAWDVSSADEARFKRILKTVALVSAAVCALLLLLPRPADERVRVEPLAPRMAKLILERDIVATPPVTPPKPAPAAIERTPKPEPAAVVPPKPDAKPEPKAEAKPAPADKALAKANERAPKPEPKAPVPEARNPLPDKTAGEVEGARRKASGVGLLAMKDTLAELHSAPAAVQLKQDIKPGPGVGTGPGPGVGAGTEAGLPDRALITSKAAASGSGGINTSNFSRDAGGGGLAGRSTTLVEGVAGGGGGGAGGGGKAGVRGNGSGDGVASAGGGAGGSVTKGGGAKAARSIEDIKLVFDRNKGAIYALYNRALRDDSSLQGKVVVELKIAPSGQVIACRLVSSELKSPELESKLVARIRMFDFGAKEVEPMVVSWPVDFLPS